MSKIVTGLTVNALSILIAGFGGLIVNKKLNKEVSKDILSIISVIAIISGLSMALKSSNILISMICLVIACILGYSTNIDRKMNKLMKGKDIFDLEISQKYSFTSGLMIASMISLIGPLSVVGSIQLGINGDMTLLVLKSGFDFIATFILTTSLGKGVIISVVPIFLTQFLLALVGKYLGDIIPEPLITELSATGGIVLIAMGLTIAGIKKFKVLSLLIGLFLVPLFYFLFVKTRLI